MKTIYLEPDKVPTHLRGSYTGRKFTAVIETDVDVPADAGLWSDGSRNDFVFMSIANGDSSIPAYYNLAPWDRARSSVNVKLTPGVCCVEHSISRGNDLGLRFHLHPDDVAKLLPAPSGETLTETELAVLYATKSFQSWYGGLNRRQMMNNDRQWKKLEPISAHDWDTAKSALVERKLLNRAGAVTVAGRNA